MALAARSLPALWLLVAVAASAAGEDEPVCFGGGADSGELTFAGAVEDTGFTGRFGDFSVRYCMQSEQTENHEIRVQVRLATADSDNRDRDETLLGPEFFAVDEHPVAVWESTAVRREGEAYVAEGRLSLKGITAPQSIRYRLEPDGGRLIARGRFVMSGGTRIDRQRYQVGTGEFADPEFVRNQVTVEFEVELTARVTSRPEPPAG